MKTYEITYKEARDFKTRKTSFTGDKDIQYIIDFFGLEEPDIVWYDIKEITI